MTTQRQTMKQSTITVTTEQQRISLTNMFTLHYQLLWYKWCYTVCLGVWVTPQRCGRKVSRTLCISIYRKQCRIDRTLYSTLLNSTHFFSVVDRTLTHFFWSTGWEVWSKSLSHSSLCSVLYSIQAKYCGLYLEINQNCQIDTNKTYLPFTSAIEEPLARWPPHPNRLLLNLLLPQKKS